MKFYAPNIHSQLFKKMLRWSKINTDQYVWLFHPQTRVESWEKKKSGKLKFNVKLITPMGTLAYWHKTAREVQRTIISYFLQTLLHTSKNLVGSSVSYLFRVLFSLFFSWQFKVFLCQILWGSREQVDLNYVVW